MRCPRTVVDLELCVRMDFGNGEMVDGLPFQQCGLGASGGLEHHHGTGHVLQRPEGFAMQAMAVHTCVTQEVCLATSTAMWSASPTCSVC